MADTRINALSTATVSLSDDYLPIDGTTAGTKKLSAYSPSFGGNATVGGTLTVTGVATASAGILIGTGTFADGKLYSGAVGGLTIAAKTGSSYDLYIAAPDGNAIGYVPTGTKTLTLASTTASTSTSSGALVVSGGVGVAGRMHVNGVTTGGDNETHVTFVRNGTVSIGPDSTGTPALVVSTAIKTSAPSGGTAANWKLGTVATVSPTSPNRTIEVEIGGTTYYLHAKTTNN